MYIACLKNSIVSGFRLLVMGRAVLMSPKGRNTSRDGLVKIGWVVILIVVSLYIQPWQILDALFRSYAALLIRRKVL